MKYVPVTRFRYLLSIFISVFILYSCEYSGNRKSDDGEGVDTPPSPTLHSVVISSVADGSFPKLVVGIVIDQMRYDFLTRYSEHYRSGGFKKLVDKGYSFSNTKFNYVPTTTCPGHASIYTGTTPSVHGIIGNDWFDDESGMKDDEMYCAYDKNVYAVGLIRNKSDKSKKESGGRSPRNMLTSTVTDELRLATNMKSKVIGISLKDRGAIMPAGHLGNAAYWLDDDSGKWITSSYYFRGKAVKDSQTYQLPEWVREFNEQNSAEQYLLRPGIDGKWDTLHDISTYTANPGDDNKYENSIRGRDGTGKHRSSAFPYDLKEVLSQNRRDFKGRYGKLIRATPFGNSITADFVIAALKSDELNLGRDGVTDFLAVSFSSTDIIAHYYGTRSIEVEDAYLRFDRDIERLLTVLDEEVGEGNYLIFLTADHGAADVPLYLEELGVPAGYFMDDDEVKRNLNMHLKQKFDTGNRGLVSSYSNQQVYLDRELIGKDSGLEIVDIEREVVNYMMMVDGVADAVTASDLNGTEFSEGRRHLVQNGFNRKRSGNVAIIMEPSWIEFKSYFAKKGTTHGAPYNYDTHVPLVFYGWKIKKGESLRPVEITDIAPTISALLGIPFPNGATGNPLTELWE